MSNAKQETIADIINEKRTTAREIRSGTPNQYGLELAVMLEAEANRIEAAHKREKNDLRDEIASLRAALNPVLELEENNSGLWPFASLAVAAVKEAKRIYNEHDEGKMRLVK